MVPKLETRNGKMLTKSLRQFPSGSWNVGKLPRCDAVELELSEQILEYREVDRRADSGCA